MARVEDLENQMAKINIEDEENEELFFADDVVEDSNKFDLCLVGRFLTEKNMKTRAVKSKLADIWRLEQGINIKDLKPGVFLFQFYPVDDLNWVTEGGPWSFVGAILVLSTIPNGGDPVKVPLLGFEFLDSSSWSSQWSRV